MTNSPDGCSAESCDAASVSDTPLQAIVQQAIMAHPHFEGSAALAFGLAGAALKAIAAARGAE
jgi:hypothetical protein